MLQLGNHKFNKLRLNFENLESIDILMEHIDAFHIEGVSYGIYSAWHTNDSFVYLSCTDIVIKLNTKANLLVPVTEYLYEEVYVFDRIIKFNDISGISLIGDNEMLNISVPFEGEYYNELQNSQLMDSQGGLLIKISNNVSKDASPSE